MGNEVSRTVETDAPSSAAWGVLAAPERWPQWTTSMDAVDLLDGRFGPGARVRIRQLRIRTAVWTVIE